VFFFLAATAVARYLPVYVYLKQTNKKHVSINQRKHFAFLFLQSLDKIAD